MFALSAINLLSILISSLRPPRLPLLWSGRLEKLLKVRATLNEGLPQDEQLSLNDMLLRAAAIASEKVPDVSTPSYFLFQRIR